MARTPEEKMAEKYHDTFEAKQELYKLMKKVIFATGNGYEYDDYCEALHLCIGNGELVYDPYYRQLRCLGYSSAQLDR